MPSCLLVLVYGLLVNAVIYTKKIPFFLVSIVENV